MFYKHSYKYLAISRTANTIARNTRTNFQVFLTHSLYGIPKYVNPYVRYILVGAINIVTP